MRSVLLLLLVLISLESNSQNLSISDLERLAGEWNGVLMYKDYSSGKATEIPARIVVSVRQDLNALIFNFQYPDEPSHNESDTLALNREGSFFGQEKILSFSHNENGFELMTETRGMDNEKPSVYNQIYRLKSNAFHKIKSVKPDGSSGFFIRSEYRLKKN